MQKQAKLCIEYSKHRLLRDQQINKAGWLINLRRWQFELIILTHYNLQYMESALTTITHATPVFFWSVVLANFIWVNRYAVYNLTKKCFTSLTRSVITRSKRILSKRWSWRLGKKKEASNDEGRAEQAEAAQTETIERIRPAQNNDEVSTISRKVTKPIKKNRNARRISRNWEQCILRRAYTKMLEQKEDNEFRQRLKQIEDRKWSGDVTLTKKQTLEKFEDIQKFVEEQLDVEDDELFALPYDPFEEQESVQNESEQEQKEPEAKQNEGEAKQSVAEALQVEDEPKQGS